MIIHTAVTKVKNQGALSDFLNSYLNFASNVSTLPLVSIPRWLVSREARRFVSQLSSRAVTVTNDGEGADTALYLYGKL